MYELNELIVRIRSSLTSLQRKVIVALTTTDVHARDIVLEMVEQQTSKIQVRVCGWVGGWVGECVRV